ncbi:adenosine receptor A3-like [Chanos chanos]|uniref:Adenosine receptor A3-like n=1 Tax=Chanos chanos TaxID=29144 RepID=A0A6J2VPQ8_CHACN|nr:adenosine receptor A3-like [Chanos chanos]
MADVQELLYTLIEVLIAVGCCLGNMFVIWAVWKHRALRKPTYYFVMSLAVADFLVGAVTVPLAVLVDGRVHTSFHNCLFISCVVIVPIQASVLSLLAIAIDRYLCVRIPLRFKRVVTLRRVWIVVGVCWLSAGVLGFIPLFGWNNHESLMKSVNSTTITCAFITVVPMSYLVNMIFFSCFLPPLAIMAVLYFCVFTSIRRKLRGRGVAPESNLYYHKERRLAGCLTLVLVLFIISWLPLHIMNTVTFYLHARIPHSLVRLGILLTHVSSAINPVVYAFKIPKIHSAYRSLWKRVFHCFKEPPKDQKSQSVDMSNYTNSTSRKDQTKMTLHTTSLQARNERN